MTSGALKTIKEWGAPPLTLDWVGAGARVRCRIFLVAGPLSGARELSLEKGEGPSGKTGEAIRRGKEGRDSQRTRLRLLFRSIISIESKISRSCAPYVLKRACMCGRAEE
jgi:hypothetical protein